MANFFHDNDDIEWYLRKGVDWRALIELTETMGGGGDTRPADEVKEEIRETLALCGRLAGDEIAPRAAKIDEHGTHLVDGKVVVPPEITHIFDRIRELDLHWMCIPRELDGMNMPLLTYFLGAELFARADVSVMTHHSFHGGMAMAMLVFSLREGTTQIDATTGRITSTRFSDAIAEIGSGTAWGTMDITEPDAGSDMAALRTRAEQDEHGQWFLTGEKIFITSGHGKWHFVIARSEPEHGPGARSGLDGLSFFLAPAWQEHPDGTRTTHIQIGRVEEKLGHHGSVTAQLHFDRAPAQLIGKRGEGFRYMLTLMNNARLGVGFECIGLAEAAYRAAKAYAQQRPSMGKTIDQHEMIADWLDEMDADIRGLRALAIAGAVAEETHHKLQIRLDHAPPSDAAERARLEREIHQHRATARRLTPLLKYLAAEKAVEIARRSLQIHGGNGYMREYGVEKLLRDALVMPIYEGTSQIQSLMVVKDTFGAILAAPSAFLRGLAAAQWAAVSARDPLERRVARMTSAVLDVQQILLRKTVSDKWRHLRDRPLLSWPRALREDWNPKRDFAWAMLHAERLTRMLADDAIATILLEQTKIDPSRRELLARHLDRAEPRSRWLRDEITHSGASLLRRLAAQGEDADAEEAAQ